MKFFFITMNVRFIALFTCLVLGACTPNSVMQQPAPPSSARATAIDFAQADAQERMRGVGILDPFTKYWDAQVSGVWEAMFRYEIFDVPLTLDFYKAYHARAWEVLNVAVLNVDIEESEARVRVGIQVKNPKNSKSSQVYREDTWVKVDGTWRHKVTDPLMSANR